MKYKAPPHTADVHVSGHVFTVDDAGFIEVPEETPSDVVSQLVVSGFQRDEVPSPAKPVVKTNSEVKTGGDA